MLPGQTGGRPREACSHWLFVRFLLNPACSLGLDMARRHCESRLTLLLTSSAMLVCHYRPVTVAPDTPARSRQGRRTNLRASTAAAGLNVCTACSAKSNSPCSRFCAPPEKTPLAEGLQIPVTEWIAGVITTRSDRPGNSYGGRAHPSLRRGDGRTAHRRPCYQAASYRQSLAGAVVKLAGRVRS